VYRPFDHFETVRELRRDGVFSILELESQRLIVKKDWGGLWWGRNEGIHKNPLPDGEGAAHRQMGGG